MTGTASQHWSSQHQVLREGGMAAKNLPKKPKRVLKASLVAEGEDEYGGVGSDEESDSDKPISHMLLSIVTECPKEWISWQFAFFSWTAYLPTFRASFTLKFCNYIENVLVNRNINSESKKFMCGHYKMGMCLACPKECRNTVCKNLSNSNLTCVFSTIIYLTIYLHNCHMQPYA